MLQTDEEIAQARRLAVMQAELEKTVMVDHTADLDALDRLIVTHILKTRLETPAVGPRYAHIGEAIGLLTETTARRRCKALEERGIVKRLPSGLSVCDPAAFFHLADQVYELYRRKVLDTEADIPVEKGGCGECRTLLKQSSGSPA